MLESMNTGALSDFEFGTKGETLARLLPILSRPKLCEQVIVDVARWRTDKECVLDEVLAQFRGETLAVRSSAASEDTWVNSNAGAHLSLMNVESSATALTHAIDRVIESYLVPTEGDQALIQPMVENVVVSGVVLTRDLDTGGPYYVVSYDDLTGRTDTVTGGAESKTIFVHRGRPEALHSPRFHRLIESVIEIESVTGCQELDIEFCMTRTDDVYILQVRPITMRNRWATVVDAEVDRTLDNVRARVDQAMRSDPRLAGRTTIFGEMPDWNPAEMIGTAPRPLALSLYRRLITDRTWARARAVMGYRNIEERALLNDLAGRPFIDVRLSLNSFLPAGLDNGIANRIVDQQLDTLAEHPEYHDKLEFAVAYTCRDFSFPDRTSLLRAAGLSVPEMTAFEDGLAVVTRGAIAANGDGVDQLLARTKPLMSGPRLPAAVGRPLAEALEDCIEFGTLPFSQLARHAFIGVAFLRSLVDRGVLSEEDKDSFMRGVHTVAADVANAIHELSHGLLEEGAFLARFGHLRPGTYDILSWRYDERPDLYLGSAAYAAVEAEPFVATPKQNRAVERLLLEFRYEITPEALIDYIGRAIAARETAKFAFSRRISEILAALAAWGESQGFSRDDLSYLNVEKLIDGFAQHSALEEEIAVNRERHATTRVLKLPSLIIEPDDVEVVRFPIEQPSFITSGSVTAETILVDSRGAPKLADRIVLIESADPGFDWIFSHGIAGLVTKYGGANSHMAIRCAEFGLAAAIGCGERIFESLLQARVVELNCGARTVRPVG